MRIMRSAFHCILLLAAWLISPISFADTYTVGVVPQSNARALHSSWAPILEELHKRTGHTFILRGSASITEFERQINAGEFDFAYMNPYHYIKIGSVKGYIPLVRDTENPLVGILVVKKDSAYTDVKQLQGQRLVFPSPNALAASLLMRAQLVRKFGVNFKADYVISHDSVYLNVALGRAAAGGGVASTLQQQPLAVREQLRVLYTTLELPAHPLASHQRVPVKVRDQVRQALLEMARNDADRILLGNASFKSIGTAMDADYKELKALKLDEFYVDE